MSHWASAHVWSIQNEHITTGRMLIGFILITLTCSQENLSCVCRNVTNTLLKCDSSNRIVFNINVSSNTAANVSFGLIIEFKGSLEEPKPCLSIKIA